MYYYHFIMHFLDVMHILICFEKKKKKKNVQRDQNHYIH